MPPFQNFDNAAKRAIRRSHELAIERGQRHVSSLHLLAALLLDEDSFIPTIFERLGGNSDFFVQQLLEEIEEQNDGGGDTLENPQQMFLTTDLAQVIELSLRIAKHLKDTSIGAEHLFLALFEVEGPAQAFLMREGVSRERVEEVLRKLKEEEEKMEQQFNRRYRTLAKYSQDLTELAAKNELDPVIGRKEEIERLIHILSRRTKNNPILIGEPGIGKTAIVEGLAQRIARGDVPRHLKGTKVLLLDLGSLLAGTKYRGEFEERLKRILREIEQNNDSVVLFIDEIHTLIGAGASEGSMDAANMLKPALARGKVRIIGATTRDEYQKYFEKDAALVRRFQPIFVEEPSEEEAERILEGLRNRYEHFHGVRISDDAIRAAVDLSTRYLSGRNLPDKAIDLIDEASSQVKISLEHLPEELREAEERMRELEIEREHAQMLSGQNRVREEKRIRSEMQEIEDSIQELAEHWRKERGMIDEMKELRTELASAQLEAQRAEKEGFFGKVAELRFGKIPALEKKLGSLSRKLARFQKESSFLRDTVQREDVARVLARWTGIPVEKMLQGEYEKLARIEEILRSRVKGQDEAIQKIADAIRRSRVGIHDPKRPIGSFLFLGPTGVGKTELTKALAEFMFDDEDALVRIDMSEFMEKHAVSKLIGAPPGYVGYDNAGVLTEAVRHRPYAIVLFDEIEKAHPDIFHLLLQILDEGRLTDSKGRTVDFRNTIIILTSNLGSQYLQKMQSLGFSDSSEKGELEDDFEKLRGKVLEAVQDFFQPEFLNRLDEIILFHPLAEKEMELILDRELEKLTERLGEKGIRIQLQKSARKALIDQGFDPKYGARSLKRVIQRELVNRIAKAMVEGEIHPGDRVSVRYADGSFIVERKEGRKKSRVLSSPFAYK